MSKQHAHCVVGNKRAYDILLIPVDLFTLKTKEVILIFPNLRFVCVLRRDMKMSLIWNS